MPTQEVARQWFIPGAGIDRHVITTDIQRYLGNDATVRPGRNEGVDGYWLKAYRNLTSAMIQDLRSDSARWSHERQNTGVRGSNSPASHTSSGITEPDSYLDYVQSRTFQQANGPVSRRNADSPAIDGPYDAPANQRSSTRGGGDAMQIDPPPPQSDRSRYSGPSGQPGRGYPPDNGPNPQYGRDRYAESRAPDYPPEPLMTDQYGRVSVSQPYQDPRFAGRNPPMVDGAPQGYVRQGDYYVPITSGYGQPPVIAPSRPEVPQYQTGYGQPAEPQRDPRGGRDPRDARDPRYGGAQPDFNDARYYPSPATTAASVGSRDTISSPSAPSGYGGMQPQYDQYGRPLPQQPAQPTAPYGGPEPGYPPLSRGDPSYGRQPAPSSRQPAAPVNGSDRDRDRDARRRRLH